MHPIFSRLIFFSSLTAMAIFSANLKAQKRDTIVTDTVKFVEKGVTVSKTIDRSKLWAVQTPQTFKRKLLFEAYDLVKKKKLIVTDEASAVENICKDVRLVSASLSNIKITAPEDLPLAAALLKI